MPNYLSHSDGSCCCGSGSTPGCCEVYPDTLCATITSVTNGTVDASSLLNREITLRRSAGQAWSGSFINNIPDAEGPTILSIWCIGAQDPDLGYGDFGVVFGTSNSPCITPGCEDNYRQSVTPFAFANFQNASDRLTLDACEPMAVSGTIQVWKLGEAGLANMAFSVAVVIEEAVDGCGTGCNACPVQQYSVERFLSAPGLVWVNDGCGEVTITKTGDCTWEGTSSPVTCYPLVGTAKTVSVTLTHNPEGSAHLRLSYTENGDTYEALYHIPNFLCNSVNCSIFPVLFGATTSTFDSFGNCPSVSPITGSGSGSGSSCAHTSVYCLEFNAEAITIIEDNDFVDSAGVFAGSGVEYEVALYTFYNPPRLYIARISPAVVSEYVATSGDCATGWTFAAEGTVGSELPATVTLTVGACGSGTGSGTAPGSGTSVTPPP